MGSPKPCESKVLDECCKLLTFATENKTALPSQIIADIEAAWDAEDRLAWSPEVATKFWSAYDGLCSHLRPVTIDTLSASYDQLPSWLSWLGSKKTTTLARRSARVSLIFLLFILVASLAVAYVTTNGEIAANEIDKQMENGNKTVSEIRNIMSTKPDAINPETPFDSEALKPEERKWVADLRSHILSLFIVADTLYEKSNTSVFRMLLIKEYPLCDKWEDITRLHCYYKGYIEQPMSLQDVLNNYADVYHYFENSGRGTPQSRPSQNAIGRTQSIYITGFARYVRRVHLCCSEYFGPS